MHRLQPPRDQRARQPVPHALGECHHPARDSQAQAVWSSIQASGIIPAGITPKGTVNGDFSSFTPTYPHSDPDCWWTFNGCDNPKHPNIPADLVQCPEPNTWGLTFDDGPNCTHNAFYDFLQKNKQKATMFYIGSNVLDWPLEAQRGIVDGHHICVHTWSHQYMTAFPSDQVFAELYYTAKVIKDVVGVTPTCWRPPFGDVDDRVRAIAKGLGLETVLWTDDTDDWKILPLGTLPTASIDANYASIIAKETQGPTAGQGNIVLTHEINGHTMDEFMKQYANIQAVFKHIVPLTACKNQTKPYPEDITYPDFAQYVAGNINATGLPSGSSIKAADNHYNPQLAVSATASGSSAAASATAPRLAPLPVPVRLLVFVVVQHRNQAVAAVVQVGRIVAPVQLGRGWIACGRVSCPPSSCSFKNGLTLGVVCAAPASSSQLSPTPFPTVEPKKSFDLNPMHCSGQCLCSICFRSQSSTLIHARSYHTLHVCAKMLVFEREAGVSALLTSHEVSKRAAVVKLRRR